MKPGKLFKYLTTGGVSFLVEYSVFLLLVYVFTLSPWIGQAGSYSLTLLVNFWLLRKWAFKRDDSRSMGSQAIKYGMLVAINLPLTTLIVDLLVVNQVEPFIAKLIVVVLAAIWNFIIYDRIIFRSKKKD